MSSIATRNLTTLDLIKALAVVIMIADHVGFYLSPPVFPPVDGDPWLWLRAIGRIGLPVWFFLAGYARPKSPDTQIWVWAGLLLFSNMAFGMFLLPLNALFSMIIIRLIIGPLGRVAYRNNENLLFVLVLLVVTYVHSNMLFEYGSLGVLMALLGYGVRRARDESRGLDVRTMVLFGIVVFATCLSQALGFRFDTPQLLVSCVGMLVLFSVLTFMPFRDYPRLTKHVGRIPTAALQLLGRRTLEIYVIHLIVLRIIAWSFGMGYDFYGWFDWHWTMGESFMFLPPIPGPAP